MSRAGELIVRLKQAKGIRGDEAFGVGKADLFANLSLGGEKRTSKVVTDGGSDTVWNEEFSFKIAAYVNMALYESLRFYIYDQDYCGDSRRGTVKIDVKSLLEQHEDEVPDREYPVMFHGEQRGVLVVGFSFKPANVLPVVQPELTTVTEKEESALDHLIHKIQHMGQHHHRKPRKFVSAERQPKVHAEQKEEKEGKEEEKHSGWTSESESEYESESESESHSSGQE